MILVSQIRNNARLCATESGRQPSCRALRFWNGGHTSLDSRFDAGVGGVIAGWAATIERAGPGLLKLVSGWNWRGLVATRLFVPHAENRLTSQGSPSCVMLTTVKENSTSD